MEVAALGLRIDGIGNIDQASTSLGRFTQSADSAEKSASALDPASRKSSQSVQQLGKSSASTAGSMNTLASTAMKLGGVIGAAFSVTKIVKYADAWSDMQSRVGAATGNMDTAGASMQRLLQIANASYSPLEQTAEIYSRNVSTFRDLGRSAGEAADFTESLNHMLVLTATRGERAASVQNALSKAMAVGKLQADGLETVLANGGEVAQALAKELGTTVSGLRDMASQGKITSSVIAGAVVKSLEDVRDRAAEMPATMGDAFTRVGNNLTAFIGTMDQATGASGALAAAIIELSDAALEFGTSEEFITGLLEWQGTLAALAEDFGRLGQIISDFAGDAGDDASSIGFSFGEIPANIRAAVQIATVEIAHVVQSAINWVKALADAVLALKDGPSAVADAFRNARQQQAALNEVRLDSIAGILDERHAILDGAAASAKAFKERTSQALDYTATAVTSVQTITKAQDAASKKRQKDADAAERFIENLKQQLFQTEKRTAAEKVAHDIQRQGLKLSEAQLDQAMQLAGAIDAVAQAERDKSAEIDRQNTSYRLQESLIAKQQEYSSELSTRGMGSKAAGSLRDRIAIEQAQQKELRDMQHQHGQEMRAAESEAERSHLQAMYAERLAMTSAFMAQELAAYDNFNAQKAELDGNWLLGAQEAFASYAEQAADLYTQTAELVSGVMQTLTEGIAESMTQAIMYGEDLRESMANVGRTIIESVLNSLIQMGVQYGINAAMEIAGITAVTAAKNAAIASTAATSAAATATTTATQVSAAATTTAAWTPAAIASSIGSFGAAAAIGLAAVIAALAFSGGFKQGGYTGNGGVSDVAGVVHGREYVFDSAATARIGVPTLEAIRAGRPVDGSSPVASSTSAPAQNQRGNVTVNQTNNFGAPDNRTANQIASASARKQRMATSRLG